jgi:hypothetical protein
MWKKALWLYLALYTVGLFGVLIDFALKENQAGRFDPLTLLFALVFLIPAGVLALNLRGKKISILLTLLAMLITSGPVAAILNFNTMDLATIGKALLFVPMIGGLVYYGYKKLFKK